MKKLKVLFVSPEIYPFTNTGLVSFMTGDLVKALKDAGHEIRVMIPRYGFISERKFVIRDIIRLKDIQINTDKGEELFSIKSGFLPDSKVQVYFVENSDYFGHDGIYSNRRTGKFYKDNDERFIFFSHAVLKTIRKLGWSPDVIHCNGWATSLIPVMLRTTYQGDPFFSKPSSVITIYDLSHQEIFDNNTITKAQLSLEEFSPVADDVQGQFNVLRAGINYTDMVSTLSKAYAKEIQAPDLGLNIHAFLASVKQKISGIEAGINYAAWNPETNKVISNNFSAADLAGKAENRNEWLKSRRVKIDDKTPLVAALSGLTDEDSEALAALIPELMKQKIHLAIQSGKEDKSSTKVFRELSKKYGSKISLHLDIDQEALHKLFAAADMALFPDRYNSVGYYMICAMRFGAVPISAGNSAGADLIKDASAKGNGFLFKKQGVKDIASSVRKAISLFQKPSDWKKVVVSCLQAGPSWEKSSVQFSKLYEKALKKSSAGNKRMKSK